MNCDCVFPAVPPRIEQSGPIDRKITVHDTVELPCAAEGVPTPRITWQKGTRVLANSVGKGVGTSASQRVILTCHMYVLHVMADGGEF